jgi:hypothetical protein
MAVVTPLNSASNPSGIGMSWNPAKKGINPNIVGGIGSIAGGLFDLGNASNPAEAALPYVDPYLQAGQKALGQYGDIANKLTGNLTPLQEQFMSLIGNPGEFINKIGGGFQHSPGYQAQLQEGEQAAANAAAAGGMAGSPQHQKYASQIASDLANKDYYNWLAPTLGLYQTGLGGLGNLFSQGYQGLGNISGLGEDAATKLIQAMTSGQSAQQEQQGAGFGNIIGGITSLLDL